MSHQLQRMRRLSVGFKGILVTLLLLISLFCIFSYTSNLLLSNCPSLGVSSSLGHLDIIRNVSIDDPSDGDYSSSLLLPRRSAAYDTDLKHIVFGIAASSNLWEKRKEYIKTWWQPKETLGVGWLDKRVRFRRNELLPEIRVSADTSRFQYTNWKGQRAAIRISRVVSETLRLGMKDVRWFVMGDDDTIFIVDNVVRRLSKYNHRQFYYVRSSSESHVQNIFFSYSMAHGGGGLAVSYPLAVELAKMQDKCIQQYPGLYGSDDRMQACMAELGVPITREPGFHQDDVYGSFRPSGGPSGHSSRLLHHIDVAEPIFPQMTRARSLHHCLSLSGKILPAKCSNQSAMTRRGSGQSRSHGDMLSKSSRA
ncbi:hypothetical protein MLD38_003535 [Melastoma candidum]|uniref:Uncharacterized protein n=1 Tax=Melastoma candidum TaxID=119954 RepID=A0ACB9S6R6_9MYRT|nr:hypothetical protein MLD38_003535 [Melastoma candidum]